MKGLSSASPVLKYRNRSIRLTPEGILHLLLTLAVGAVAINTANNLLYLLMALMLTLIIVSGILSEWCLQGIRIECKLPSRLFAHEPVLSHWVIHNTKSFLPSYTIRIEAEYPGMTLNEPIFIPRILAGETQVRTSSLTFERRGVARGNGYRLGTGFPFGFFEKTVLLPIPQEVLVYPRINRLWMVEEGLLLAGNAQRDRKRGEGADLYNLRDYQYGDNPRHIHWKVSARQAKLLIQERGQDSEHRIQIRLVNQIPPASPQSHPASISDAERDFEEAVSLTASLVYALTQKGCEVGLSTLEQEIPPRSGKAHLDRILRHLALLQPLSTEGAKIPSPPVLRSCRVILVLPWEDPSVAHREHYARVITPSQWKQLVEQKEQEEEP